MCITNGDFTIIECNADHRTGQLHASVWVSYDLIYDGMTNACGARQDIEIPIIQGELDRATRRRIRHHAWQSLLAYYEGESGDIVNLFDDGSSNDTEFLRVLDSIEEEADPTFDPSLVLLFDDVAFPEFLKAG